MLVVDDPAKSASKQRDSRQQVFEEFFQDYFKYRHKVYLMNFVRGIWFGLGTVIGGSVVVALILWLLALFHNVPFLSGVVETIQRSIEEAQRHHN